MEVKDFVSGPLYKTFFLIGAVLIMYGIKTKMDRNDEFFFKGRELVSERNVLIVEAEHLRGVISEMKNNAQESGNISDIELQCKIKESQSKDLTETIAQFNALTYRLDFFLRDICGTGGAILVFIGYFIWTWVTRPPKKKIPESTNKAPVTTPSP